MLSAASTNTYRDFSVARRNAMRPVRHSQRRGAFTKLDAKATLQGVECGVQPAWQNTEH
jgi:hypothetical protein